MILTEEAQKGRQVVRLKGGDPFIFGRGGEEAMALADMAVVMNLGLIEQVDIPPKVYNHPATEFVARFIGGHNIFASKAESNKNNN